MRLLDLGDYRGHASKDVLSGWNWRLFGPANFEQTGHADTDDAALEAMRVVVTERGAQLGYGTVETPEPEPEVVPEVVPEETPEPVPEAAPVVKKKRLKEN